MSNGNYQQRQRNMSNAMSNGFGSGFASKPPRPTPSPSTSLPNLAVTSFKQSFNFGSPMIPPIFGTQNPVRLVPPRMSKSTSSMSLPKANPMRSRLSIPTFDSHTTQVLNKTDSSIPNPHDIILGALRAGDVHFPRGMKSSDILEVVYSVYTNIPKTQASETSLKRTLENLVAKGAISRSFGAKASDATFRIVNVKFGGQSLPGLDCGFGLNLTVSGIGIKPNISAKHFTTGQGLPSGKHFQTRVAQHTPPPRQQQKPPPIYVQQKRNHVASYTQKNSNPNSIASFTFSEKRKLSKSLASRVGAIDTLKPLKFIPNSPVTSSRSHGNSDSITKHSNPHDSSDYEYDSDDHDQESEDDVALSQRFRDYAQAVLLDSENGDNEHIVPSIETNVFKTDVQIRNQPYSDDNIENLSVSELRIPSTSGGGDGDFTTSIMMAKATMTNKNLERAYSSKGQIEAVQVKHLEIADDLENGYGNEPDDQFAFPVPLSLATILEDATEDKDSESEEVSESETSADEDD